jgi:hypothetical protein
MAGIIVETPRLQLMQLTSNAEGSVHLDLFHNVWRDKQATQWRYIELPCRLVLSLISQTVSMAHAKTRRLAKLGWQA